MWRSETQLRQRALPSSTNDEIDVEPIEEGWEEIDSDTSEDPNYNPKQYAPPGPVESSYQSARFNANNTWEAAKDAYEAYLRGHVEATVEALHEAARAAAMSAAARAAMTSISASQSIIELFTGTTVGENIQRRLEHYRLRLMLRSQIGRRPTVEVNNEPAWTLQHGVGDMDGMAAVRQLYIDNYEATLDEYGNSSSYRHPNHISDDETSDSELTPQQLFAKKSESRLKALAQEDGRSEHDDSNSKSDNNAP